MPLMRLRAMRRLCACTLILLLAACPLLPLQAPLASAATDYTDAEPSALQRRIEQTADAYNGAAERLAALDQEIKDNTARIEEIEQQLPEAQSKSDAAIKSLYLLKQEGFSLLDMVLGAKSLEGFFTGLEYLERIHQASFDEINRLSALKDELGAAQIILEDAREEAKTEALRTQSALFDAQSAREEARQLAVARAEAEAAEAAQIQQEQAEEQNPAGEAEGPLQDSGDGGGNEGSGGSTGSGGGGSGGNTPSVPEISDDRAAFISQWAGRIDAYLGGSPLAGQGSTFAAAAWDYGVDPRWSPAISCIESSKGAACYFPYNAWGWGNVSWGSWEEAINAHVRGLASGYGYTISVEAAKKYCPLNWEHWYNSTLAQMNMI